MPDYQEMAADVVKSAQSFVTRAVAGITKRIDELVEMTAALDARIATVPAGKDGQPGTSAYQLACLSGFAGSEKEWLDSLHGVPGALGVPGVDGKSVDVNELRDLVSEYVAKAIVDLPSQPSAMLINEAGVLVSVYADGSTKIIGHVRGADGARGASIMDGALDDAGQLVLRMSDGRLVNVGTVKGADGKDGVGLSGARGRDAIEIRILPGIDDAKSYGESVCARYRGGVIRAERQTDPLVDGDITKAGWSVILEGIAEETERSLDDGRVIERETIYTTGRRFLRRIETAAMLYRGVWRDSEYSRGDTVTWDGSSWHANATTRAKPGTGPDWTMANKRGQNGKDGKDGQRGASGIEGRAGRDLTQLGHDGSKF